MATATKKVETVKPLAVYKNGKVSVTKNKKQVQTAIVSFIDSMTTVTARSTFYNKKKDQDTALAAIHDAVYGVNRGLYASMLLLPGVTNISMQKGILRLISEPYPWDLNQCFLSADQENEVIRDLTSQLPITNLLRMFVVIKDQKINNSRSRKMIFNTIIGSKNLSFWSIKYKDKMKTALVHALGQKKSSALRSVLEKAPSKWTDKEKSFVKKSVDKYADNKAVARECICFILGGKKKTWKVDLISAFYAARKDFDKGVGLPPEVLEGIRSRFHSSIPAAKVIEKAKSVMSQGQKMAKQRSAKKAGVELEFDPTKQDMVKLYVYAQEEGGSKEIRKALDEKAKRISLTFPMKHYHVGVVVDSSLSMFGSDTQKHRPISIALSMKDVLAASAEKATVVATNGSFDKYGMIETSGSTSLADALLEVVETNPDAVYMISDGYENAPAGRVNEVINALRDMDIDTPIFQISPVMSAETAGLRSLSDSIEPLPVSKPEGIGLSMIRAAISQGELEQGIAGLLDIITNRLVAK